MKKVYIVIIISILFIIGFAFYWYEYRPAKIREYCNAKSQNTLTDSLNEFMSVRASYDDNYKKCLRDSGIEK